MLRLAPLTDSFRIPYAWDDAIDQGDTSTPEGLAAFEQRYARCLETLDFSPIVRPGMEPTWFVLRPLKMSQTRDILTYTSTQPHKLSWLAVRVALDRIDNIGDVKLERSVDSRYPELGKLLTVQTMDVLEQIPLAYGREPGELVDSLFVAIHQRSTTVSGK